MVGATRAEEMMGIGQRWHVVERMEEMGSTVPWRADGRGWSCCIWPKNIENKEKIGRRGGGD
jgi:hypothetical protein